MWLIQKWTREILYGSFKIGHVINNCVHFMQMNPRHPTTTTKRKWRTRKPSTNWTPDPGKSKWNSKPERQRRAITTEFLGEKGDTRGVTSAVTTWTLTTCFAYFQITQKVFRAEHVREFVYARGLHHQPAKRRLRRHAESGQRGRRRR